VRARGVEREREKEGESETNFIILIYGL